MDYCDRLVDSIRKFNTLILQAHYMKGSTNLAKMASLYLYREVYDAMRNVPTLSSKMPYAMMAVLKISSVDVKQFVGLHSSKNFYLKRLRSGKVNYSGTPHDEHFTRVMRCLERWFDKKLRDSCPTCGMDTGERLFGYSNELDIGLSLSFPITVDASGSSSSANSRTVDFRMVYMAGYSEKSRGIISFPIISAPSLEWCAVDDGHGDDDNKNKDDDCSSKSSSSKSSSIVRNDDSTSSDSGIHDDSVKHEHAFSKVCCLLHYLWTREITGEMLNSNSCFVRLLSINPSRAHVDNIQNKRYFIIKNTYKNIGYNYSSRSSSNIINNSKSVYVQEFAGNAKVILLL
uniref:Wsv267-like protein n=1 Tax=Penaeus semisulcatus majanivirus TaxID=2984274 RepID=A0A9C7F6N8_9VIRU|nr:MAG: wsv267-like protein [Penaeus semisulcatus majanivirus]